MNPLLKQVFKGISVIVLIVLFGCSQQSQSSLDASLFRTPPQSSKVHTWWHWMDGNISKDGITKDLEAMKEQGIVQATILNIGLLGDTDYGVKKVDFASPEWYNMFKWALDEADRLGIKIGIHNCDGWSTSGGPWITPEMSMKEYTWTKTVVNADQAGDVMLQKPKAVHNFYKDVAVVAVKNSIAKNSFHKAEPTVYLNNDEPVSCLNDGSPVSAVEATQGITINFKFNEKFKADKVTILPRKYFIWGYMDAYTSTFKLSASNDGKHYTAIKEFTINGLNSVKTEAFNPTEAKYFQLKMVGSNNLDAALPFYIAECELISANEKPLFSPDIEFFSQKSGNVKPNNKQSFYNDNVSYNNGSIKQVLDLTTQMDKDGKLNWKPESGLWTVYRFGYTTTGAVNAPATKVGEGLECDKMDTAAVNLHFNSFPAKLIQTAGNYTGNTFKFMLVDSWECRYQNWTANMPEEFEKLNGYSLIDYIPVLCGETSGNTETDEAVLYDLRATIAHLIENNYYKHFSELLHKNKMELHAEVIYGGTNYPALDILRTTKYVDLPMYEFWAPGYGTTSAKYNPFNNVELNMPACAAIGYEKQVFGSEAYTGMAHYGEYPEALKPFGDRAFCTGINQMILHSNVHQPTEMKPGLTLGEFAAHFNRHNPCWNDISEWLNYQSRIQYVLQQGNQHQDVLYFLGDQLPQFLDYNRSNTLPFGYSFNACNADILKNRIVVENGKMILNGKHEYSILCLPDFNEMSFETIKLIEKLVQEGVVLYGPKPEKMLSLNDIKNNKAAFKQIADKVWGGINGKSVTTNSFGKGRVYWGVPLAEVLVDETIYPDLKTEYDDAKNLMFIHKKMGNSEVYFVMNQQNDTLTRELSFRVKEKTPKIWDAETGNITNPVKFKQDNNYTTLPVSLAPYQSLLFVFTDENPVTLENKKEVKAQFVINDFKGKVEFEPAYNASVNSFNIRDLSWLTESEIPDVKYFSGKAVYTLNFDFNTQGIQSSDSLLIDIGAFGEIAHLNLNGSDVGIIWKQGQQLPITDLLKKTNTLKVEVSNTYRNRFIGDFRQYGEVRTLKTSAPITRFLSADSELFPAGLEGPVQIVVIKK